MDTTKIELTDILRLKTLREYKEAGDEITELVEMLANQYVRVIGIESELNEFGERTYVVERLNEPNGLMSVTDHEIAIFYKAV